MSSDQAGPYTAALGRYIAAAQDRELPADLAGHLQLLVLDSLGCALFAARLPWTERVLDTMLAVEGPGPASVWGRQARLSAANAALVNGTAVHGFELDDVGARGHWGSVTVTAALALAEAADGAPLSGAGLLRAVAAGIEVGSRAGACVGNVPHVTVGFHGPAVLGALAAAATSASVLGLGPLASVHALANAAQFASGLMGVHHDGMGKRLLQGKAAHSGVLAAQLAAHGFTNITDVFECGYGSFPAAFSGGRDTFDLGQLTAGLGEEYRAYGVNFKLWPARVPIHPALEAAAALLADGLDPAAVERVDVALVEGAFKAVGAPYRPTTVTAAQLSLRYCLAQLLTAGQLGAAQFTEDAIRDPRVLDLAGRIDVRQLDGNPDGAAYLPQVTVDVVLRDGRRLSRDGRQRSAGHHPVTRDDVVAKFLRITNGLIGPERQHALIERCDQLPRLPDARALADTVRPADAKGDHRGR
jgi:aconitate decarboxylase